MENYGFLRVAAAMPRVHVADPDSNVREILNLVKDAVLHGVSVVAFPELSVTGYTCADLFGQQTLVDKAEKACAELVRWSAGMDCVLVFGTPERIPFEAFYNTVKAGVSPNISIAAFGGSIVITKHALICLAISVVVLGVLFLLLKYSKWGLGVRATASNEFTAELMGIDTRVITAVSWAVAGALGVLAAVMYAGGGTTISASFMTTIQVNAFLAGILGGFSTFYGPVIGAVLIPLASSCVGFLANFPGLSGISRWQMVVVYALMLVAILIKPQGLFGKKTVKKV